MDGFEDIWELGAYTTVTETLDGRARREKYLNLRWAHRTVGSMYVVPPTPPYNSTCAVSTLWGLIIGNQTSRLAQVEFRQIIRYHGGD